MANRTQFTLFSRLLHWLMAAMILTMLFIGITMVASLGNYHALVSIHRPLGIAILILAAIRFVNRQLNPPPDFLDTMPPLERLAATSSELLMYFLMFALPLVGWGMLSAGSYPIVLVGSLHLPPILPQNAALYSALRKTHTVLAYLFFATFLAHFSAILFHTLIVRDRILDRMALWRIRVPRANGWYNSVTYMRAIAWLLRVFCYLFHTVLSVGLLLLGFVAVASGVRDLKLEVLPWHGEQLNHWLIGLGIAGLLSVALAITGKLRFLLALWSIYVAGMLMKAVIFSSSVTFSGRADFDNWLWLTAGALLAMLGSFSVPSRPRA